MNGKPTVAIVMPAYNAEKTLEKTVAAIPAGVADLLILVDDASKDGTVALARQMGLTVFCHERNRGYGGNQKTCYREALALGADIVVMLHPDFQYDPAFLPDMVAPLLAGQADMVLGSRLLNDQAIKGGMPVWKWLGNKFLTGIENLVFNRRYSEYHTGYRAYNRRFLENIPLEHNSEDFVFDQEVMAQAVWSNARVAEIAIPARYFLEASSVGFRTSVVYGLKTLRVLAKFVLYQHLKRPVALFSSPRPADAQP